MQGARLCKIWIKMTCEARQRSNPGTLVYGTNTITLCAEPFFMASFLSKSELISCPVYMTCFRRCQIVKVYNHSFDWRCNRLAFAKTVNKGLILTKVVSKHPSLCMKNLWVLTRSLQLILMSWQRQLNCWWLWGWAMFYSMLHIRH